MKPAILVSLAILASACLHAYLTRYQIANHNMVVLRLDRMTGKVVPFWADFSELNRTNR